MQERKNSMKSYWMLIMLGFITHCAFGQGSELAVHLYGMGALPAGDYSRDLADDSQLTRRSGFSIGSHIGLAATGFGMGAELVSPVGFRGLQWLFSVKGLCNGSNTEALQADFRKELGDSVALTLDYGQWLNLPVMTGFRYDYQFTAEFTLYSLLQAGINFSKMASRKASVDGLIVEDAHFDFARDFGFEWGIGVLYNQRYNLGFRYLDLRHPRYEGRKKISETIFPEIVSRDIVILGEERSISLFVVTLGIQLFK